MRNKWAWEHIKPSKKGEIIQLPSVIEDCFRKAMKILVGRFIISAL